MADATKKGLFQEESVRSFKTEERRVIFASSLGKKMKNGVPISSDTPISV